MAPSSVSSSPSSSRSSSLERVLSSATSRTSCDAVGTGPDEYYDQVLSPWRAGIRKFVMRSLAEESAWIARMQKRVRSSKLDNYFLYSSALGAHTCFMLVLPALYFFGFPLAARALVTIIGFGVYTSSYIKDLVCSPRPFTPPVERLTIGSHHLEYGFPSTHSTNSVSIALYIFSAVHELYVSQSVSTLVYVAYTVLLGVYALSVVLGRLYTGMHSITDVSVGTLLGALLCVGHGSLWLPLEDWLVGHPSSFLHSVLPTWTGPLVTVIACGLMVHRHPQPAEDCPCFEDAIAVVSVLGGVIIARFASITSGVDNDLLTSHMPGSAFAPFSSSYAELGAGVAWKAAALWWSAAIAKLIVGFAIIFTWRLAVKFLLHSLLPPLFRFLARWVVPRLVSVNILPQGTGLPNRRFYTPATEYRGAVPTVDEDGALHAIPSMMDLPAMLHRETAGRSGSGNGHWDDEKELGSLDSGLKKRKGRKRSEGNINLETTSNEKSLPRGIYGHANGKFPPISSPYNDEEEVGDVKRYDADVLTKVVVYAGIGFLSSWVIPVMFEALGWGVKL